MNRRLELTLITGIILLATLLRTWDVTRLPPGFNNDELAYIRMTELVREGEVAVHYQMGDGLARAGMYAVGNALLTTFTGDGLAGYRLGPLFGSLVGLALLYALARRLYGVEVALIAAATLAVNTRAVLLARTATAESLVPAYTLLTLFLLVIAFHVRPEMRFRAPGTLAFGLLAALFGLSGYLHYSLLVMGPLGALFLAHMLFTQQPLSRRIWSTGIFVIVMASVIALPYLISTLREPELSEPYILSAARPASVSDALEGLGNALGGLLWRGDDQITLNVPDMPMLGPAMAVLLVLGVVQAVRRWREPRYVLPLLALAAGVLTDAWVNVDTTFSANLVAMPAAFLLGGIGAMSLWHGLHSRRVGRAGQAVAVLVIAIVAANLYVTASRLFDGWSQRTDVGYAYHASIGHVAAYLDRTPDEPPVSVCGVHLRDRSLVGASSHDMLGYMMHRDDMDLRTSDCRSGLVFINGGQAMRFVFLNLPDFAAYYARTDDVPPALAPWLHGDASLPIAAVYEAASMRSELADWLKDGEVIDVPDLPEGTVLRVDVSERIANAQTPWSERPTLFMPVSDAPVARAAVPVAFEHNLTFKGYEVGGGRVPDDPRNPVVVVTYWRVDGPLPDNLRLWGQLLKYHDQAGGRVPTDIPVTPVADLMDVTVSELHNEDIFVQVLYIPLPRLEAGEYPLTIGAHREALDDRLQVLDREANGQTRGTMLWLGDITLQEPLDTGQPPPSGEGGS